MANLYGVANAPGLVAYTTANTGNTSCTHDVYTTIFTSPALVAPSNGYFYALCWATLLLQAGASIPLSLSAGLAIGAGSVVQSFGIGTNAFVANGYIYVPVTMFTGSSQTAWQGTGSTISVQIMPATNTVTAINLSCFAYALFRAPDQ